MLVRLCFIVELSPDGTPQLDVCLFVYFSSTQKHKISNQNKTDKYTQRKNKNKICRKTKCP